LTALDVVALGLVQGITEFLPISSSGHLVISQQILGVDEPGVILEVTLHFATILAVLAVFRKDILGIFGAVGRWIARNNGDGDKEGLRLAWLIVVGSLPAAVAGLALKPMIEDAFDSVLTVGFLLGVTGLILFVGSRLTGHRQVDEVGAVDALAVGAAQSFALLPGISRSGSTIVAALGRRMDPLLAAKYSLLLSVPAVLGANLLELPGSESNGAPWGLLALGMTVAFVSGVAAIKLLIQAVLRRQFHWFALYCVIVGTAVVIAKLT